MSLLHATLSLIGSLLILGACVRSSDETGPNDTEINSEPRIVGGKFAGPGQAPHQASLRFKRRRNHFCGGSIIGKQWILTAAHCLDGLKREDIAIVVGTNSLAEGGQWYNVKQIIPHEAYEENFVQFDIGLVEVDRQLEFSDHVKAIALSDEYTPANVPTRIYGFGLTSFPGRFPSKNLKYLDSVTMDNAECQKRLYNDPDIPYQYMPFISLPGNICVLTEDGTGACQGDSGGALIDLKKNQVCGVVSWGKPCAEGQPDVYSRINGPNRNWIEGKMGEKLRS